ncbi:MAG: molybdopterin dinucleotide binding domain-containing protein [Methanotrichaceae archaeon]
MAKVEVTIVTYRDIFQEEAKEIGRYSDEYRDLSALILLDRGDMKLIETEDGQTVQVETDGGMVVVKARLSDEDEEHPGLAFMPNSPWSNQLVSGDTGTSKIPEFKRIRAEVSATDKEVETISDLVERIRAD